jgi:hypothetical protein
MTDEEAIDRLRRLPEAWLIRFRDGWWACFRDERPLGPFDTEADASRAGLEAWLDKRK